MLIEVDSLQEFMVKNCKESFMSAHDCLRNITSFPGNSTAKEVTISVCLS
ncbi:hypothetical protein CBL_07779 [Carabus blaptoides fortunei]